MTLPDEQILPAVIVEIFQPHAPAGTHGGDGAEPGLEALVGKQAAAIVVIEGIDFARQHGGDDIGLAVVVVVLKYRAHAGKPLAVGGEGHAGLKADLGKGPVAVVVKQKLLHAVVGNENVREAVAIVIGEG